MSGAPAAVTDAARFEDASESDEAAPDGAPAATVCERAEGGRDGGEAAASSEDDFSEDEDEAMLAEALTWDFREGARSRGARATRSVAAEPTACSSRLPVTRRQRQRELEHAATQRTRRPGSPSRGCVRQLQRRRCAPPADPAAACAALQLCNRKASACSGSTAASTRHLCRRCGACVARARAPSACACNPCSRAVVAARRARRERRRLAAGGGCNLGSRERATRVRWSRAARGEGGQSHCGAGAGPAHAAGKRPRAVVCDAHNAF